MKSKVYLADLRHNFGGVLSTDCMPLGVGYMKAVMDRDIPAADVASRVFAYPDKLLAAMNEAAPDVLMVSNYVWNEQLGLRFARKAKELNPGTLTVMGGPNIPFEPERQIAWLREHPEIDVYVLGEGDFLARDIVKAWLESGCSIARLRERDLPSAVHRRPDGTAVRTEQWQRGGETLGDIPSPWLTGVMDEFFDGRMAPIIETNRGCPFKCTFCVQGTDYYTKLNYFDMGRLEAELLHIAKVNHERSPHMGVLRIADANYGMYERDVDISRVVGRLQKEYRWPSFIDATTGKNRAERIIDSMEQVNGALMLYQAVQSLDDEVLRNISRSNIKLSAYEKLQVHVRGRGLRSTSDLILGLPGESLQSHLKGLYQLIDAGTNQAHCFQAMMLKGAEMETVATREKFKFGTRFRVLPKNFGIYDGEKVFDMEEIIVETATLPFQDYLQCRKNHVTFSVFWNDSWFNDVLSAATQHGIKPSDWLKAMLAAMEADEGAPRKMLDDFVRETVNELFPTREACDAFYRKQENFDALLRGEIGDNLMYKYRAKVSFFLWPEICALAMKATKQLMIERGAHQKIKDFDRVWADLAKYVESRHAWGSSADEVVTPAEVTLNYDIQGWLQAGAPDDTTPWRLERPQTFVFRLSEEGSLELASALKVWTSQLTGLTKLVTRIRVQSQVRSCQPLTTDVAVPS